MEDVVRYGLSKWRGEELLILLIVEVDTDHRGYLVTWIGKFVPIQRST
jgi:hypothetical protein